MFTLDSFEHLSTKSRISKSVENCKRDIDFYQINSCTNSYDSFSHIFGFLRLKNHRRKTINKKFKMCVFMFTYEPPFLCSLQLPLMCPSSIFCVRLRLCDFMSLNQDYYGELKRKQEKNWKSFNLECWKNQRTTISMEK